MRLKADLPQRKVAAAIDVDTATYCKFEKDVLRISREQLLKYAEFLKTDANDLLALWLADQIYAVVKDEKFANEAMQVADKKINPKNRKK